MSKKKKILLLITLLMGFFLIMGLYKLTKTIKYAECENNVFSNPEYLGGSNFKALHKKCMREKSY